MHHSPTILLALFTATALAKYPYVHSFYNADCTLSDAGDQVNIPFDECVKVDLKYDAVQINFGGGLNQIKSLSVFSDDDCNDPAAKDFNTTMPDTEAQCVSQKANGAKWGSVAKTRTYVG